MNKLDELKNRGICVITNGYPTPCNPTFMTFVDQLVCAWADIGIKVTVVNPVSISAGWFNDRRFYKPKWERIAPSGNKINVYHPRFLGLLNRKLCNWDFSFAVERSRLKAVKQQFKDAGIRPAVLYSHFLTSGRIVSLLGKILSIPAFCAFGESSLWSIGSDLERTKCILQDITGFVSVSTENRRILIEGFSIPGEKIRVFLNGVNHNLFRPMDKATMRNKLGLDPDGFFGVYTGSFTHSKGVKRVQLAAEQVSGLKMIYIGSGGMKPSGKNIIFCNKVKHDEIPYYLNAADFFVLPTLAEGCCNAILEAMSCGLPIISANRPYNKDIMDDTYALSIDPEDINMIANAMMFLRDNPGRRLEMGKAARKKSLDFDILDRAKAISEWMASYL